MTLEKERRTIGVFPRCSDAQLALEELKAANFPMHKVSLIARDAEEKNDIASVEVKDSTGNTSSEDSAGAVTGLLVGFVLWLIPGIGRVILAGAEATAIATTLAGGAINVTAGRLHGVLLALGIPKEQAQGYSDLVCKGYYLVIVTGMDIEEIRLAKMIFNRCNIQQWVIYEPYSTPNSRYKNAVGIFSTRQDTQRALTELKTAGFAMSQVSVIAQDTNSLNGIIEVEISSSKDNYTNLGIPDELARYYQHEVTLGNYLLVLNSTDIYIAGARAILESHKIQHFRIYSQSELDATRSDR